MKRFLKAIPLILWAMMWNSCQEFPNPFADKKVLAEVGKETLYLHDLSSVFTEEMAPEDSVKLLKLYVDQWVRQQLKVQEAEELFASSQRDIDRMVEEYRNSLLTYKIDQFYVDRRVDTLFTEKQITDYYNEHKDDFILDKDLIKGRVARLPSEYRQMKRLKELMQSARTEEYQDFVDICLKNGFELKELTDWTETSSLTSLLPQKKKEEGREIDYLATPGKLFELKDGDESVLIKIDNFRRAGDYAPIERVSNVIKRVLFNQRKQEIIKAHEDSLYRNALISKDIVVNVN